MGSGIGFGLATRRRTGRVVLGGLLLALAVAPSGAEAITNDNPPSINPSTEPHRDGQVLVAHDGDWTATPEPEGIVRVWRRCSDNLFVCSDVGSGQTYQLTGADVSSRILLQVTACDSIDCQTASDATGRILSDPSNDVPPAVAGTARDGETLSIASGSNVWTGTGTITLTYQWQRCGTDCADVSGATGASYVLTPDDVGSSMRVLVRGDSSGGPSTPPPAESAQTQIVTPRPPVNTVPPEVGGTPRRGHLLGLYAGEWTGTPPLEFSAIWQRCRSGPASCVDIDGEDGAAYRLTAEDVGRRVRVVIRADNAAPGATIAVSALSEEIAPAARRPTAARLLTPFPRIAFGGLLTERGVRLRVVRVRGPRAADVRVRCHGPSCPFRRLRRQIGDGSLRIAALEIQLPAGTVIEVLVTKPGRIGKYTRFTIRQGSVPLRHDSCAGPGDAGARRCPR